MAEMGGMASRRSAEAVQRSVGRPSKRRERVEYRRHQGYSRYDAGLLCSPAGAQGTARPRLARVKAGGAASRSGGELRAVCAMAVESRAVGTFAMPIWPA